jgi:hypothetical protein
MKRFIALAALISFAGCTTLRQIEGTPAELQGGIVQGTKDRVPVDQIVSVQKREFSRVKTFLLVGGGLVFTGLIVYAAAHEAPAFALGGRP